MNRTISFVTTVCIFAIASAAAGPVMDLSEGAFDFGYVPQHVKVAHTFWVRSTGDDTLRVTKIIPDCMCTKWEMEKQILAPGDSARLVLTFDTERLVGRITKSPTFLTNEGSRVRKMQVTVDVYVRPDTLMALEVKPNALDITQFGPTVRDKAPFTLINRTGAVLNLRLIDWPADLVEIDLPAELKPGESAKGTVRVRESALGSEFQKSFTFEANDKQATRFTVPLTRQIKVATPVRPTPSD